MSDKTKRWKRDPSTWPTDEEKREMEREELRAKIVREQVCMLIERDAREDDCGLRIENRWENGLCVSYRSFPGELFQIWVQEL